MTDNERIARMSDIDLKIVWNSIWEVKPNRRPDDSWVTDVYSEMSKRGIPA